jgi:hypothetical protein
MWVARHPLNRLIHPFILSPMAVIEEVLFILYFIFALRHCERSAAIQRLSLDCFVVPPRKDAKRQFVAMR